MPVTDPKNACRRQTLTYAFDASDQPQKQRLQGSCCTATSSSPLRVHTARPYQSTPHIQASSYTSTPSSSVQRTCSRWLRTSSRAPTSWPRCIALCRHGAWALTQTPVLTTCTPRHASSRAWSPCSCVWRSIPWALCRCAPSFKDGRVEVGTLLLRRSSRSSHILRMHRTESQVTFENVSLRGPSTACEITYYEIAY